MSPSNDILSQIISDWNSLIVSLTQLEIQPAIQNVAWQRLRVSMKGEELQRRYWKLKQWLEVHPNDRTAQVQVANYVNALKRGGMIK